MDIDAIKRRLDMCSHIYIYGAGLSAVNTLQTLWRCLPERCIEGIVVTDKTGNPAQIGGLNVISLEELTLEQDCVFFWIAAGSKHQSGIIQELESAGYCHYAVLDSELIQKLYMLAEYEFTDRRCGRDKVLFLLAGYKEFLWDVVFDRMERFIPSDVEICVLSSGIKNIRLQQTAQKNGWSYLCTVRNSVTMIQNIAMAYYPDAKWFYKMDEDIFLTKGALDSLLETFERAAKTETCLVGMTAPLIPVNGYGYVRILEKTGMRSRYEQQFDKVLSGGHNSKKIETDSKAAAFMWGATGELPQIDQLNRICRFGGGYSLCNVRLSIGCILYSRAFWDAMEGYPYGDGCDMGKDERQICYAAMATSHAIVIDEGAAVGHFSFGPQTEGMKEYYTAQPELFTVQERGAGTHE